MITQRANVNLIPNGIVPELSCSKGDNESRTVLLTIYAGEELFRIPAGAQVFFQGTAADGTTFRKVCTYDGAVVTTEITSDMTAQDGVTRCELAIVNGTELIRSQNIKLYVEGI